MGRATAGADAATVALAGLAALAGEGLAGELAGDTVAAATGTPAGGGAGAGRCGAISARISSRPMGPRK
jgi:hypothetical protein